MPFRSANCTCFLDGFSFCFYVDLQKKSSKPLTPDTGLQLSAWLGRILVYLMPVLMCKKKKKKIITRELISAAVKEQNFIFNTAGFCNLPDQTECFTLVGVV